MAKPIVPPALLKAIAAVGATRKEPISGAKSPEASPIERLTERQSIRPARTAIAHQRGGNKGK
ncbi:MAG: hypothetical protein IPN91_08315 [Holophagaceae bacterium]|jgi:hypothetical protein|uniref:Uncharacterized protein n=1 Tax=Candidatus Geothrix odensensis TaxID=2954440 RepID=A0A936F267_9BACT|nr:hypothetical protein [Candidatus Geothrix odensensis]